MKHCKGCSHPTICNTMGCAAEEARANKAAEPSYAEIKAQRDELLSHLKKARDALENWLPRDSHGRLDAIDAAIAKVEGGAA